MQNMTLNSSIAQILSAQQDIAAKMAVTQQHLSTGKKVNSAVDDPIAYFQAQALTNQASDLAALKDNMATSIQAITAASKGIDGLTALVNQAKSLAQQAKSAATAGLQTLSSSLDLSAFTSATVVQGNVGTIATGNTFTVQVDGNTTKTITVAAGTTLAGLAALIQGADSNITASYNSSTNKIDLVVAPGHTLKMTDTAGTAITQLFGAGVNGTNQLFGSAGSGASVGSLQTSFVAVMAQIDALINDTGYNGVNLLKGNNLVTSFNAAGTSSLTTTGVTYDSTGLGFTAAASVDWTTTGNIDTSISEATAAIATLRSQSSAFGVNQAIIQTRTDFTTGMITTLNNGAGTLVNADMSAESANMLSLQTQQQLSLSALSMANQSQQSILQLFR
jgi:flagellin